MHTTSDIQCIARICIQCHFFRNYKSIAVLLDANVARILVTTCPSSLEMPTAYALKVMSSLSI